MTPDLIIQLIASATGTGGLIALFLITEKKTAARLENTRRIDEKWQSVIARQEKELELLSRRYEAASRQQPHALRLRSLHGQKTAIRHP